MNIYVISLVTLVFVGIGLAFRFKKENKPLRMLNERNSLSNEEIYDKFYSSSGLDKGLVIELWHEIAKALRVPAQKLIPTDAFGKDVGAYWITSESLDHLSELARKRSEMLGLSTDLSSIKTVDDYVKAFAKKAK